MRSRVVIGQVVHRWTVVADAPKLPSSRNRRFLCRCECGTARDVFGASLASGQTKSCGCWKIEAAKATHTRHGESKDPVYKCWTAAKSRCSLPQHPSYADYGGRGIKMAEVFMASFEAFRDELGPRPTPQHSVDRRDNDRGYEPGNIRWATRKEQAANKRIPKPHKIPPLENPNLHRWQPAELALLAELYSSHSAAEIAARLHRTELTVFSKAHHLGLRKPPLWPESALAVLREKYADTPTEELAALLQRSADTVYAMAKCLGLRKSKEYKSAHSAKMMTLRWTCRCGLRAEQGKCDCGKSKPRAPLPEVRICRHGHEVNPTNRLPDGCCRVCARINSAKAKKTARQKSHPGREEVRRKEAAGNVL